MNPLITVDELGDQLLLDVRYPGPGSPVDGRAAYRAAHIPGAVYLDMDTVLAAPHLPGETGRHPLPSPETLQAGLRAAGVDEDSAIVVYDDWNSIAAARAWWLLRHAGLRDVRVLDGGWRAWTGPTESGEVTPEPGTVTVAYGSRSLLDATSAAAFDGLLLDARPANRYRGEDETIDPVAGHIPGAVSLPALDLVSGGRLRPADELAAVFVDHGVTAPGQAGAYCGSGLQASLVALAASVAGVDEDLAVYAGSWSDWITDPARPVAR
ncbi:sulfurtransferase [Corynebacterium guangdongense]|uniref:Thiosulfate/3-mercaptopyruvate sulfurtransferase n=1 Tax=Corynebacterium guangdongense TaxID=1783348 RepID=A0ABU2A097_9CORY|nr:sulfurtransferase [Corynebacterium guangdongense]MDR7330425.1 thiosulfate/3-mercaptopyruvate sulfurtransferase [Corynebacterium guangdongense]WJZ18983.1 3-mercaptopyruvate sulfurtransferase [Corynebacterium guangdongense]